MFLHDVLDVALTTCILEGAGDWVCSSSLAVSLCCSELLDGYPGIPYTYG